MPQLHLYVDEETAAAVRKRARASGQPVSRYLSSLVVQAVAAAEWPAGWFEEVYGSWSGEPLAREPEPGLEVRDALRGRRR